MFGLPVFFIVLAEVTFQVFGGYLCDLWGQNQANIIREPEIVCNAAVTASVEGSSFSVLLCTPVAVQLLIT